MEEDSAFCGYCGARTGQTHTRGVAHKGMSELLVKRITKPVVICVTFLMIVAAGFGGVNLIRGLFGSEEAKIIEFGGYEWRVLEEKDGRMLVISEYVIEMRFFHDSYSGRSITWENIDMRQ